RKTAASRLTRAIRTVAQWCRANRHRPIAAQYAKLCQKLRGHFAYFGITGNSIALTRFRDEVRRVWRKWLSRRRRKNRPPWSWFARLQERYRLPYAVAVHSVCRKRSEGVT
ncbi:MAG: group II intron maturase-specific domain-containing protein, partial [Thermoguttaceae bacterium]|nr:group II intron maturase-specific domain-containing protein [Thermoguttaceae bacterium]